jgi:hypothetical protein
MFRRRSEAWERLDASITEKCYSMKEIKGALRRAGFKDVSIFDAEHDMGLIENTGRKFFLARKAS